MGRHRTHRSADRRHARAAPGPVPADVVPAVPGSLGGLLLRAALLGVAVGSRASLAVAAPTLADPRSRRPARVLARLGVVVELTGDLLPSTPSRLDPPGPQSRALAAAFGGAALARQRGRAVWAPAATAALFSTAGTWGGAAWRSRAARRGPDWRGALAEDAAALALAALATGRARVGLTPSGPPP